MTLLICNVGGADLICADLPKERRGERGWAEEVLARYDELRPLLRLPIIGKALAYLASQGLAVDAVVLIASDQPVAAPAGPRFWESDTCHTAAVIARMLADGAAGHPPLPVHQITTWVIADESGVGGDPSDYDLVLGFLERRLAALTAATPDGPAFLEVTGGTPAMTTGLLIAGTEAFGPRAELLSIHPRRPLPSALNTGRRLLAAPLRATLRSNAATCAYDAALATLRANRDTIADRLAPGAVETIEALLDYARCRYSFDFPGARAALATLRDPTPPLPPQRERGLGGEGHPSIADLAAQVAAPDRADLLAEVVHGAVARYQAGLYADFLTQLVRFEENLLRLLCLDRGVRFTARQDGGDDDDGSLISRAWLRAQPFTLSRDYDDGRDRPTSRALLRELLGLLAHAHGENLRPLLADLDQLRPLVYLRNELTHSLDGVRQRDLAERFAGRRAAAPEADTIIPHLSGLFTQVAGRALPPSPFVAINALLDHMLGVEG
ncbi:hypothetical protein K2Z83_23915 [Oscillochloris sp. ZM17-4]|uniref:hypothetical protein n=1 Tax=Oscillochloris sp. ZM17-4 TaxID=2866714 RepID=UPI001C735166|nr:hypothetical protein [Oscillochloris sp. ZM17-4]MBX0330708.1 hypothetical protein [Oscillochloris sp. ZM17-4]